MAQTTLRDYLQQTEDAISSGRIDEAFTHCQYILSHFPDALEAQRLLGEVYLAQNLLDDAQQTFDWVLTNDPENVVVYCNRALISERQSDIDTALDCYQQAYELSRGNSQIRQQFNQLSASAGQQGFIFSRAGLARLYMRGDLLQQAIQEWEIVLSATPDRLDARTGLLETYWREGLYDQVEQLATQIIQDVPGCLKALLLLAHVIYPKNTAEAQDLLKRAEALDPEFVMAQELFSDFMASNPNDPFLSLLKKPPVVLPDASENPIPALPATNGTHGMLGSSEIADSLLRWNSLDNLIESHQNGLEAPAYPSWSDNQTDISAWSSPVQPDYEQSTTSAAASSTSGSHPDLEAWTFLDDIPPLQPPVEAQPALPVADIDQKPADTQNKHQEPEEQPWYMAPQAEVTAEPLDAWNNQILPEGSTIAPWDMTPLDAPDWLDSLNKSEKRPEPVIPPVEPEPIVKPEPKVELPRPEVKPEPVQSNKMPWEESIFATSDSDDEDESPFMFGPEWLKSLGATVIGDDTDAEKGEDAAPFSFSDADEIVVEKPEQPEIAVQRPVAQSQPASMQANTRTNSDAGATPETRKDTMAPPPSVETPVVSQPAAQEKEQKPEETHVVESAAIDQAGINAWLDQAVQKLSQPEQNLISTLEELEKNLRSQGFTPLEPGSLSAIAQQPDTSLSSAFAQFGSYQPDQQNTISKIQPVEPAAQQPSLAPVNQQPDQISALPNVAPSPSPYEQPSIPAHMEALSTFSSQANTARGALPVQPEVVQPPVEINNTPQVPAQPSVPPVRRVPSQPLPQETFSNPVVQQPAVYPEEITFRPVQPQQPTQKAPAAMSRPNPTAYRPDALLDGDLETTMKRPVVRLQPMQRAAAQPAQPTQVFPGKRPASPERIPQPKVADSGDGISARERLHRGYQYQLAGAYDDAMQEYRIIIRTAPELLVEVISNMRALLKVSPKYSAGYRVLGDAYMRQGEYLQAMEAYNKALTMAKKARG